MQLIPKTSISFDGRHECAHTYAHARRHTHANMFETDLTSRSVGVNGRWRWRRSVSEAPRRRSMRGASHVALSTRKMEWQVTVVDLRISGITWVMVLNMLLIKATPRMSMRMMMMALKYSMMIRCGGAVQDQIVQDIYMQIFLIEAQARSNHMNSTKMAPIVSDNCYKTMHN